MISRRIRRKAVPNADEIERLRRGEALPAERAQALMRSLLEMMSEADAARLLLALRRRGIIP